MTDKREAILNATLTLVARQGFHGTSMAMIAKEASVSAGIIYHYFESKDALMIALYRALKRRMVQALITGFTDDLPLREGFRRVLLNFLDFYIAHPQETAFIEQFANSPYMTPEIEAEAIDTLTPAVQLVQRALDEGVIKPLPMQVIATFTSDVTLALAKKHIAGLLVLDDRLKEAVVNACWDALKA